MFNFKNFFKALGFAGGVFLWFCGGGLLGSQLDLHYGAPVGILGFAAYMVVTFATVVGYVTRGK